MSGRDFTGSALAWVLLGAAVVYGGYQAAVHTVTVPVILPLLSTLGCTVAMVDVVRRWRMQAAIARQHDDRRALPQTVYEVLTSPRTGPRIGDRERDIVVNALHTHYAAGRLTQDEVDVRLAQALNARTLEDLADAVDGLPSEVDGR